MEFQSGNGQGRRKVFNRDDGDRNYNDLYRRRDINGKTRGLRKSKKCISVVGKRVAFGCPFWYN